MALPGMLIIGAGECGARAALTLRERGFDGAVTLVGDERQAPYERPPLSKGMPDAEAGPKLVAPRDSYLSQRIDLVSGVVAEAIDRTNRTVRLDDGREIAYRKLLLTTGARARALPGTPFGDRVLALRSHADACALQAWLAPGRHVVIIGGGFIGLEFAATARGAGAAVTVLEGQSRVLMRGVPEVLTRRLEARHRAEGVDLRLGVTVDHIASGPTGVRIDLAGGDCLAADMVLVGIGAVPNTGLAESAGLAVDNGIVVDGRLKTSDPDIFAAGDCCNVPLDLYGGRRVRLESWRNAQEQGVVAAENILGGDRTHNAVPWFWSDQYDLTLQVTGLAEGAATTVERRIEPDAVVEFHLAADGRLLAASGLGAGKAVARDIRLAEMLIAGRAHPDPETLRDPASKLKSLLRAA